MEANERAPEKREGSRGKADSLRTVLRFALFEVPRASLDENDEEPDGVEVSDWARPPSAKTPEKRNRKAQTVSEERLSDEKNLTKTNQVRDWKKSAV